MNKYKQLANLGQSIWLDFIRRSLITSGELQNMVWEGLRGITSNPSIFEAAIARTEDYDQLLRQLVEEGKSIHEIYESLASLDISQASETLLPVYYRTNGEDGYVSLEVNPLLANDTSATISEASRLFKALNRHNIMIKIPATPEGIPAIEAAISQGINVNVTLIFSQAHYEAAALAYIAGLEKLSSSGQDLGGVASVASAFISRVDTAVDKQLAELGETTLQGKIAVANAKMIYAKFKDIFSGRRWEKLLEQGARLQRPLWASTSTKNPAYPDTMYIDTLIGPNTVNTLPPSTLQAFLDHGSVELSVESGLDQASSDLTHLKEIGLDLEAITQTLQDEGVSSFSNSFTSLMDSISEKRDLITV